MKRWFKYFRDFRQNIFVLLEFAYDKNICSASRRVSGRSHSKSVRKTF